ncbi:MAG: Crp/Fnr family transcriptional regulator [Sulfuricaulis sp.]|uniref:Crp/Fnr family transcriptional regulator n=1 Tax=Sulfuricaulis sp. TaxID=2003553 RepID=UPI0025F57462|nr:Crp/Fnr family transcriptional regulator [Sulfuricaulis sp.]MCR4347458.1 Crp/Fnr family transcriptional regulator [Sulfuricaulis sp.]
MSSTQKPPVVNHLIASLPPVDRARFLQHCEPVDLVFDTVLCKPGEVYPFVYFPLTGFVSLMTIVSKHPALEVGMIGSEGMLGGTLALGVDTALLLGIVQGAGTALRMTLPHLKNELVINSALVRVLNRYVFVLMKQQSQSSACNSFHEVDARLARWLLMSHDRSHADYFHFTHQYLGDMLGVQRSAITIAAGVLRDKKLIRYARGKIHITDRLGLEAVSCECYAATAEDYFKKLAHPYERMVAVDSAGA